MLYLDAATHDMRRLHELVDDFADYTRSFVVIRDGVIESTHA